MDSPSENSPFPARLPAWPDYRAIWRWHFYAGLFCIPFVIVLSITGGIYLFKSEIEAWQDRDCDRLTVGSVPHSASEQIGAAFKQVPDSTFASYELPPTPESAGRVIVRQQGKSLRAYVHPESLAVLKTVQEDQRLMRQMFRLHGELWMGNRGSNLVELAASWTIVLILTGLVLWWPRNSRGWGGVLTLRLHKGKRIFWRDLHSVTAAWISIFALLLLFSGLPWAKFWGDYFKKVRALTGTAVAQQDWSNGSSRPAMGRSQRGSGEHSEHGEGRSTAGGKERSEPSIDISPIDRVIAAVSTLNLPPPVVIAPPRGKSAEWSVKSMTPNRPLRVNLTVDGTTGAVTSREDFADRHLIDQIVGIGIAAHEGRLFGWPNQLLGLVTAAGLVLVCASGVVMWWKRRDTGILGAPAVLVDPRWSWSLVAAVLLLGVLLPLFGLSLLFVLLLDRIVLRRIPPIQRWLGLQPPGRRTAIADASIPPRTERVEI